MMKTRSKYSILFKKLRKRLKVKYRSVRVWNGAMLGRVKYCTVLYLFFVSISTEGVTQFPKPRLTVRTDELPCKEFVIFNEIHKLRTLKSHLVHQMISGNNYALIESSQTAGIEGARISLWQLDPPKQLGLWRLYTFGGNFSQECNCFYSTTVNYNERGEHSGHAKKEKLIPITIFTKPPSLRKGLWFTPRVRFSIDTVLLTRSYFFYVWRYLGTFYFLQLPSLIEESDIAVITFSANNGFFTKNLIFYDREEILLLFQLLSQRPVPSNISEELRKHIKGLPQGLSISAKVFPTVDGFAIYELLHGRLTRFTPEGKAIWAIQVLSKDVHRESIFAFLSGDNFIFYVGHPLSEERYLVKIRWADGEPESYACIPPSESVGGIAPTQDVSSIWILNKMFNDPALKKAIIRWSPINKRWD